MERMSMTCWAYLADMSQTLIVVVTPSSPWSGLWAGCSEICNARVPVKRQFW